MKIGFSIDQHDADGHIYEKGVFLWFDNSVCLKLPNTEALESMISQLNNILDEIKENYPES